MSSFDHGGLMHDINEGLAVLRDGQPDTLKAFHQLSRSAMAQGALSACNKELIALAIGISQHCSACIAFHVKALIRLGCSREQFEEMLGVCAYMGGGPSLMYSAHALDAFGQFEQEAAEAAAAA